MKVSEEDLAQMQADGATVSRNPTNRPMPEPVAEAPPPSISDPDPDPVPAQPSVEGEALRMLVAQNSEAMMQLGAALSNRKNVKGYDAEVIRDKSVDGDYKPITHLKVTLVRE